jgi:hypothetical protein
MLPYHLAQTGLPHSNRCWSFRCLGARHSQYISSCSQASHRRRFLRQNQAHTRYFLWQTLARTVPCQFCVHNQLFAIFFLKLYMFSVVLIDRAPTVFQTKISHHSLRGTNILVQSRRVCVAAAFRSLTTLLFTVVCRLMREATSSKDQPQCDMSSLETLQRTHKLNFAPWRAA